VIDRAIQAELSRPPKRRQVRDQREVESDMIKSSILSVLLAASFLGGCENMTTGQKGALTGAALGTGIGAVAGASFPVVVGAGLIGGAAGYITGSAIDSR
jgi:mannitol-specific phosphotransferase system IIBC component